MQLQQDTRRIQISAFTHSLRKPTNCLLSPRAGLIACLMPPLFAIVLLGANAAPPALPPAGGHTNVAQPAPDPGPAANQPDDHLRPVSADFKQGGTLRDGKWTLKGDPGTIRSRDTVFTMAVLEFEPKTSIGVATGSPKLEDPHNTLTSDKVTILDAGPRETRKAIMEGHVHIIHRPDKAAADDNDTDFSAIFDHDIVLTCDHAEYFYRAKNGTATGNILMTGTDVQNGKPTAVTLTADSLEFSDKDSQYKAVGNVVIHDGNRTIKTPLLTAVSTTVDGKRKVESVDLTGPVEITGLVDDTETTAAPNPPPPARTTTTPGVPPATGPGVPPATTTVPPPPTAGPPPPAAGPVTPAPGAAANGQAAPKGQDAPKG